MPHPAIPLPRLIAHRGLSARAPENTLSAVRAAHAAGIGWVELDVQLLGDGIPVIWHDAHIRRCSDGRGRLANLDLTAARRLDVGRWFGDAFRGERMATLEEMLTLLDELEMGVNLELKVNRGRDARPLVEAVLPPLMAMLPPTRRVLSTFDVMALALARTLAGPEALALGVLFETIGQHWRQRCESVQAYSVHADWRRLKRSARSRDRRGRLSAALLYAQRPRRLRLTLGVGRGWRDQRRSNPLRALAHGSATASAASLIIHQASRSA